MNRTAALAATRYAPAGDDREEARAWRGGREQGAARGYDAAADRGGRPSSRTVSGPLFDDDDEDVEELMRENAELHRYLDQVLKVLDQRVQAEPEARAPAVPTREEARAVAEAWRRAGELEQGRSERTPSKPGRNGDAGGSHLRQVAMEEPPPVRRPPTLVDPLLHDYRQDRTDRTDGRNGRSDGRDGLVEPQPSRRTSGPRQQFIRRPDYRPERDRLLREIDTAQVADLERRLARTEQTIGQLIGLVRSLARAVER